MGQIGFFDVLIAIVLLLGVIVLPIKWKKMKEERKRLEALKQSGMTDVDRMDDIEFETFVKMLFTDVGFTSRILAKEEKNLGADFILDGRTTAVLRLARSGPNTRIGLKTVQEAIGARFFFETEEAWVITNTIFTENAELLAGKSNVKLIDRFLLQKLILTINPDVDAKEVRESVRRLLEEALWDKEERKRQSAAEELQPINEGIGKG